MILLTMSAAFSSAMERELILMTGMTGMFQSIEGVPRRLRTSAGFFFRGEQQDPSQLKKPPDLYSDSSSLLSYTSLGSSGKGRFLTSRLAARGSEDWLIEVTKVPAPG